MSVLTEIEALERLQEILTDLFESPAMFKQQFEGADAVARVLSFEFAIEVKNSASAIAIEKGIDRLTQRSHMAYSSEIPLLVVPYMSEVGKQQCKRAKISWVDLSGNANIKDRALIVKIDGRPNQFKRKGRPRNPFAPKSSRVIRILLSNPSCIHYQKDLSEQANISKALTSQIISGLEKDGYVHRNNDKSVVVAKADLLLAEWVGRYSLSDHKIVKGHISSRSGFSLVIEIAKILSDMKIDHAFTGLAAAWNLAPVSGFRLASLYVRKALNREQLETLRFREEPRGANVWILIPNDEGVFWGSKTVKEINCVNPLQVYLDLGDHPERSKEARDEIRSQFFSWSFDGS